ncbi:MAG: UbiA family prenyltransferase [Planctomycetes bacterium]|nr:UbiA family prenyltransferase [Planctomycetota bacterium]
MSAPALLRLLRWPGILTAAADAATVALLLPCGPARAAAAAGAAALLYAGGVVLNDAADAGRDRLLHPSRPLPAGEVSRGAAAAFGAALLLAGIGAGFLAGRASGLAFAGVAGAVLAYDLLLKRWGPAGVLGMGLCRGGSALAAALSSPAFGDLLLDRPGRALLVPLPWLLQGAAVTAASLLEDSPRRRALLPAAAAGILLPTMLLFPLLAVPGSRAAAAAIAAAALLTFALGRALAEARFAATPAAAGAVVREGVFGFLLLDAAALGVRGLAEEAAAAILLWIALRALLARRRS